MRAGGGLIEPILLPPVGRLEQQRTGDEASDWSAVTSCLAAMCGRRDSRGRAPRQRTQMKDVEWGMRQFRETMRSVPSYVVLTVGVTV